MSGVFSLSTNAKEAIKVGLAMTIAYYVALRFSWMSSTWPAIAVAFISLPTAGQSIGKGLLRIGGTLLAFVAGLFFLGLFPQDRWYFFLAFTPYLAFVTYKMTGKGGQYFWFCAGFVSMMIVTAGRGDGNAFEFAAYRTFETIIGVLIWTGVSLFLWPRSNRKALVAESGELIDALGQLLGGYRDALLDHGTVEGLRDVRARAGKLVEQLEQTIGAAAAESHEVREVRPLLERTHGLSVSMLEVLDRMQTGLQDLRQTDLGAVAGELKRFFSELDFRLREARELLIGGPPRGTRETTSPSFGAPKIEASDHFERAAFEVTRAELEQLDALTRAQLDCVRNLLGYEVRQASPAPAVGPRSSGGPFGLPPLDPDRVRATVMVVASMWSASLIWIYFNPPGHASWYQFVPNIALVAVQTPQLRLKLLKPMAYAYVVALVLYVFLMPQLGSFSQLGPLIFAITFGAAYLFTGIARTAIYMGMFNMLGISNQQTYDFASQANAFLFTMLGIMLVVGLTYITRSPRPEKAFLSMLRRFFSSCEFLLSEGDDPDHARSFVQRIKRAHYLHELRSLPTKIGCWGKQIDLDRYPSNPQALVEEIVSKIQTLANRTEELRETRREQQASPIVEELGDEGRDWRLTIQQGFQDLSRHPEVESVADLRRRLSVRLARLNARIEAILNRPEVERYTDQERRNFYRLLGGFRGLTEAALAYADSAGRVDWKQWQEEFF